MPGEQTGVAMELFQVRLQAVFGLPWSDAEAVMTGRIADLAHFMWPIILSV